VSRSFNKVIGSRDRNPYMKKLANRKFRRSQKYFDIANGNSYRKVTNPWDICDWRFNYYSHAEFEASCRRDWDRWADIHAEYRNFEQYLASELTRFTGK